MSEEPFLPELDLQLVDRYLADESPRAERTYVEQQLAISPVDAQTVATVRAHTARSLLAGDDPAIDLAALATALRLRAPSLQLDGIRATSKRRLSGTWSSRLPRALFLAGSVVCLIGLGVLIHGTGDTHRSRDLAQQFRTAPGQRSTVRLSDGSTMLLGPATSAAVTAQNITVAGEAYFTVAPHTTRPFVVQTHNAVVQVLGTAFAVRNYAEDRQTRIVVDEGRVTVRVVGRGSAVGTYTGAPTVLSSRMLAQVTDSGVMVSSGIATQAYTGWTRGTLVFKGVMLRDVVTELVRAYGAEIHIADTTLAKQMVRIEVSVTEDPLGQVLDGICNVTDAHYVRSGSSYVLSPGRMTTRVPQRPALRHLFPQPEQQYGR